VLAEGSHRSEGEQAVAFFCECGCGDIIPLTVSRYKALDGAWLPGHNTQLNNWTDGQLQAAATYRLANAVALLALLQVDPHGPSHLPTWNALVGAGIFNG
jgi:hypothetical protein